MSLKAQKPAAFKALWLAGALVSGHSASSHTVGAGKVTVGGSHKVRWNSYKVISILHRSLKQG